VPHGPFDPPYDQFLATAQAVARDRPEVDLDMARSGGPARPEGPAYEISTRILQL
jgi:hypothetical protein